MCGEFTLIAASKYWPRDFFAKNHKYRRGPSATVLTTICHFADRFGALPELFRHAKPHSLAWQVAQVYSQYAGLISLSRKIIRKTGGAR